MRAVLQRVSKAHVTAQGQVVGRIGSGVLVLLAVADQDSEADVAWMKRKVLRLRIFPDAQGKLNLSLGEVGGELLVVSQFTLYGDCRKGNRPSYARSAGPEKAQELYQLFLDELQAEGVSVAAGRFQAKMQVALVNDGPITLILDSRDRI